MTSIVQANRGGARANPARTVDGLSTIRLSAGWIGLLAVDGATTAATSSGSKPLAAAAIAHSTHGALVGIRVCGLAGAGSSALWQMMKSAGAPEGLATNAVP
jgi:hypothetical protein